MTCAVVAGVAGSGAGPPSQPDAAGAHPIGRARSSFFLARPRSPMTKDTSKLHPSGYGFCPGGGVGAGGSTIEIWNLLSMDGF